MIEREAYISCALPLSAVCISIGKVSIGYLRFEVIFSKLLKVFIYICLIEHWYKSELLGKVKVIPSHHRGFLYSRSLRIESLVQFLLFQLLSQAWLSLFQLLGLFLIRVKPMKVLVSLSQGHLVHLLQRYWCWPSVLNNCIFLIDHLTYNSNFNPILRMLSFFSLISLSYIGESKIVLTADILVLCLLLFHNCVTLPSGVL